MHLFWLLLFAPAVILSQWIWPILRQRSIWSVAALVVGAVITVWLATGLPSLGSDGLPLGELLKRLTFQIVVSTDLPMLQLLAACGIGWLLSRRASRSASRVGQANRSAHLYPLKTESAD